MDKDKCLCCNTTLNKKLYNKYLYCSRKCKVSEPETPPNKVSEPETTPNKIINDKIIIINKGTGAGGSNTNKNGLPYEESTDLSDCFTILEKDKNSSKIKFNKYVGKNFN